MRPLQSKKYKYLTDRYLDIFRIFRHGKEHESTKFFDYLCVPAEVEE